jgi:hypothetical protein
LGFGARVMIVTSQLRSTEYVISGLWPVKEPDAFMQRFRSCHPGK